MDEQVLQALQGELRKMALDAGMLKRLGSAAGGVGALGGAGLAVGALGGAAHGAYSSYQQAKSEGQGTGVSLARGVLGGANGIGRGAMIGGALGAAGGAAAGLARPGLADAARKAVHNVPGAQFGQRQVHALTGWRPEGGLGQIGMGHTRHLERFQGAAKDLTQAIEGQGKRTLGDRLLGRGALSGAKSRFDAARSAGQASFEAEKMGLTNIPGYLRSMKNNGVRKTLGAAAKESWHGMDPSMKALTIGLPAAEVAGALVGPSVDEQGRGRGARVGGALANAAGGALLSPLPVATQMLLGAGGARAGAAATRRLTRPVSSRGIGERIGRLADPDHESGMAVAPETHVTDRAQGMGVGGSAQ